MTYFGNKFHNTFIFVTGSIGVGKTTIIESIRDEMTNTTPIIIKEFIDYDPEGESKLNQNLANEFGSFEFQKYVVDCFFNQIRNYHYKTLIVERHPMESLLFAKHYLTKTEYENLKNYIVNLCRTYEVPLMNECDVAYIDNIDINDVVNVVRGLINTQENLIIHVLIDEQRQVENLRMRNRESDIKYLIEKDMKYLQDVNNQYKRLRATNYKFDEEIGDKTIFSFTGFKKEIRNAIPKTTEGICLNDEIKQDMQHKNNKPPKPFKNKNM